MAITNGYTDLSEIKHASWLDLDTADDDPILEIIIEGVSRWIDEDRNRRFYSATETRYFSAQSATHCRITDLLTLTTLKTDYSGDGTYDTTWDSSDYYLAPYNAALESEPYSLIEKASNGSQDFPIGPRRVEVAGSFGYCALADVPKAIKQACLLASSRVYNRRETIFGTAGSAELGTVASIVPFVSDGELMGLLSTVPKRRRW